METILLRRYPSRKLYNKSASKYIKLPEVAELIRQGHNIHVEDTETGEDVTRQLLLQLIIDQEANSDEAILSADVLTELIRAHQSSAREFMTGFFDDSFRLMREQQRRLTDSMSATFLPWAGLAPSQVANFQHDFRNRMAQFWGMGGWTGDDTEAVPETKDKSDDEASSENKSATKKDIEELRALQERLSKLEKKLGG